MNGLERWRMRWERVGLATIPLWPDSKTPFADAWNVEPPANQWREANAQSGGWRGNLGVMPGNGNIGVDSDSPESTAHVSAWVDGLGLKLPIEKTPNDGRHFYMRVRGVPESFNWAHLSPSIGPGELRARNCYLAAQCSAIDGKRYQFIQGQPEDIPSLRIVEWRDVAWLLAPNYMTTKGKVTALPVRLVHRDMPQRARSLLVLLQRAHRGQTVDKYPTRSEAEAAIVAMLILAGWEFAEIASTFETWRPGHYRETKPVQREKYLSRTYTNALTRIATTPERLEIAEAYHIAQLAQWPGRGGLLNRATYLGLLAVAWQFSSWAVQSSERVLAEHAAATRPGVHNALNRLAAQNFVQRVYSYTSDYATCWYPLALPAQPVGLSLTRVNVITGNELRAYSELWAQARLGRAGELTYHALDTTPKSVGVIARLTKKAWATIDSALKRLAMCGLAAKVSGGWVRGDSALAVVAASLECEQAATLRHERHEREREDWRENPHYRARRLITGKQAQHKQR